MSASIPQLLPGCKLNDYRIVSSIGEVSLGHKYLAENEVWGNQVHLLVLSTNVSDAEQLERQLEVAVETQKAISHPQLAKVMDYFHVDQYRVLVSSPASGPSLREVLREGPLEPRSVLEWFLPLLDLLDSIHRQGYVLCELRPETVSLGAPLISDLAMVSRLGKPNDGALLKWGNPSYTGPDFLSNAPFLDHRADVYLAGLILYEAITARPPFHGYSMDEIKMKQLHEKAISPRKFNPAVAPELEALVLCALEKNPDLRFTGCGEFKFKLEAYLAKPQMNQTNPQPEHAKVSEEKRSIERPLKPEAKAHQSHKIKKPTSAKPQERFSRFLFTYETLFYLIAAPCISLLVGYLLEKIHNLHLGMLPISNKAIEALFLGQNSELHPSSTLLLHLLIWWLCAIFPKSQLRKGFMQALPKIALLGGLVLLIAFLGIWKGLLPAAIKFTHSDEALALLLKVDFEKVSSLSRLWYEILALIYLTPLVLAHLIFPSRVPK